MTGITKFNLADDHRSQIRFATNRAGWVLRAEHYQGPRGGRYRPNVLFVGTTETGARRAGKRYLERAWRPAPREVTLYKVDHLGNVLSTISQAEFSEAVTS